jgi:hypothetical protein
MPPRHKQYKWTGGEQTALVFDLEDATALKNFVEPLHPCYVAIKPVQRPVNAALTVLDVKTKRQKYGPKGWKDQRQDRETKQGCNDETGRLF